MPSSRTTIRRATTQPALAPTHHGLSRPRMPSTRYAADQLRVLPATQTSRADGPTLIHTAQAASANTTRRSIRSPTGPAGRRETAHSPRSAALRGAGVSNAMCRTCRGAADSAEDAVLDLVAAYQKLKAIERLVVLARRRAIRRRARPSQVRHADSTGAADPIDRIHAPARSWRWPPTPKFIPDSAPSAERGHRLPQAQGGRGRGPDASPSTSTTPTPISTSATVAWRRASTVPIVPGIMPISELRQPGSVSRTRPGVGDPALDSTIRLKDLKPADDSTRSARVRSRRRVRRYAQDGLSRAAHRGCTSIRSTRLRRPNRSPSVTGLLVSDR